MDQKQIEELVAHATESLGLEMKAWIDPDTPEGKAKIVKACIGLRNNDGGVLLLGFNDQTGAAEKNTVVKDVRTAFHVDKIQMLVAKYASESFEIEMHWVECNGEVHPVVVVPGGVKAPVAARAPIIDAKKTALVAENRVYVRSLNANNTPSTTEATWRDWPDVIARCFENREADIGRFIRRHLTPDVIRQLIGLTGSLPIPAPSAEEQAWEFIDESAARFAAIQAALPKPLPPHGALEVGAIVTGPVDQHSTNTKFLNLLSSSNRKYTGWPLWLDSRSFFDQTTHPHVFEGAWEALVLGRTLGHIDFWRAGGTGKFYHRRGLEDDTASVRNGQAPKPGTTFEFGLAIYRTGEAIALVLDFIRAMGGTTDETAVAFCFRWTGLKGRKLSAWANPNRSVREDYAAHQDDYKTSITVPLNASKSSIPAYTYEVVKPLFEIFDGFEMPEKTVEEMVTGMLSGRW